MKTTFRTVSIALMGLLLVTPAAMAQNETANAIRQKIRTRSQQFSNGQFDAYFDGIAVGSRHFFANGGLRSNPATKEGLAATARNFKANYEKGARGNTTPKSIAVQVFGSTAVASYYIEGNATNTSGETTRILRRRTRVFVEDGGQWKVVHTHTSNIVSP